MLTHACAHTARALVNCACVSVHVHTSVCACVCVLTPPTASHNHLLPLMGVSVWVSRVMCHQEESGNHGLPESWGRGEGNSFKRDR